MTGIMKIDDIFLVGLVTMYIQLVPGVGETQPTVFLIACVLSIAKRSGAAILRYNHRALIIMGLVVMSYSMFVTMHNQQVRIDPIFRSFVFIFISIGTFFWRINRISTSVIRAVINLFLFLTVFQFFFPEFHNQTVGELIPRSVASSALGKLTLLAPEPSYMACIVILVYMIWVKKQMLHDSKMRIKLTQLVLFTTLLTLGSALSFIFSLIVLAHFITGLDRRWGKATVLIVGLLLFTEQRFYRIFAELSQVDWSYALIVLFQVEPSGTSRLITSYLALKHLIAAPFGGGLGSFQANWSTLIIGEPALLNNVFINSAYIANSPLSVHAALLNLFTDVGFVLVFYILLLTLAVKHRFTLNNQRGKLLLVLIFGLYQCSYLAPFLAISLVLFNANYDVDREFKSI